MALELMDEHEKGEQVRAWLRQNGSSILGGVAVGLSLIFGWQWWQRTQVEHRITAATQFQALSVAADKAELDAAAGLSEELAKRYSDTPYATLAALRLADAQVLAGEMDAAAESLAKAATLTEVPALKGLISMRRARLALASGKAEEALTFLDSIDAEMYAGLVAETRGDALSALGRSDAAREAYAQALTQLETGAPNRRIVELKLADLGGEAEQPEV
jgi:predicted negative regulator of RcsB-dependent stress response